MSNGAGNAAGNAMPSGGLLQRLLDALSQRSSQQSQESDSGFGDLPPAGHRSGQGAASLAPYLNQFRSTRPAALDDDY